MEFFCRQYTGPGIKDLHRIDACLQLPNKVAGRCLDEFFDQVTKSLRILIGKTPGRFLLGCTTTCDHVGCNRPRRAAKPKQ